MFCSKCGTKLADGQKFCANCGTPVFQQPAQQAVPNNQNTTQTNPQNYGQPQQRQTVQNPQPQYQNPQQYRQPQQNYAPNAGQYQRQTYAPNFAPAAPVKKSNGGKIAGIVIAIVAVIALATAAILFLPKIIGGNGIVSSADARSEISKLESKDMASAVSLASDITEEITASDKIGYDIVITPGDPIKDIVSSLGLDVDISWLKNITATVSSDLSNGKQPKGRIGIGLNGKSIAAIETLIDIDSKETFIAFPGLTDKVFGILGVSADDLDLGFDIGDIGSFGGLSTIGNMKSIDRAKIDKIVNRAYALLQKYYAMALNHITSPKKENGSFTANGIEEKCTILSAEITDKIIYEAAREIAEDLKKNSDVKALLQDLYDFISQTINSDEYENFDEFYSKFTDSVDEFLESIPEVEKGSDGKSVARLTEYVVSGEIRGRLIEILDNDFFKLEFESLYIGIAHKGNDFGAEFTIDGTSFIKATGTSKNNKIFTGKANIIANGMTAAVIDFKDLDKDQHTGKITLSLSEEMWSTILDSNSTLSSLSGLIKGAEISIDIKKDGVTVDIMLKGASALKLEINKRNAEGIGIRATSNPADMEDIQSEIDFKKLKSNLKSAGVPEEYLSYIDMLIEGISY